MKKSLLSSAVLLLLFSILYSCGGDSASKENNETTEAETETSAPENNLLSMELNSVNNIEDWVALLAVKMNEEAFSESEKKMVDRGGTALEAQAFNSEDSRIKIVRAGAPSWGAEALEYAVRYLMRDDQVVLLEEAVKTDGGYSVHRIYYGDQKLLGSATLKGASFKEAYSEAVAGEYEPPSDDDFRLNYEEVKKRGNSFLAEVMQ